MPDWDLIIDSDALGSVLPAEYAEFARPVRDALTLFLSGLPERRQAAILAEQATLSPAASVSERLAALARCCPVLHKLGQILARDQQLAPELRFQLQQLESLPPAVDIASIHATLRSELGDLDRRGVRLESAAIAEASVAVVIGFEHRGSSGPVRGVFKLLKPGIEDQLEQELEMIAQVGAELDQRCEELAIPRLDYEETFQQVREKLAWEIRLDQEQEHLRTAHDFYRDEPRVQIPEVFDHCTHRVTAMQRVTGGKVTDTGPTAPINRSELSSLVVEALLARPMLAADCNVPFHCDPHAGNLFLTDAGRLAILDWSLVGTLDERERVALIQVMLAAATLDGNGIAAALAELAERPAEAGLMQATIDAGIRRLRWGEFPGLNWLVALLDDAYQNAGLRLSADLLLFRKSLHTLIGVLGDLGADIRRVDEVLLQQFVRQFIAELPWRWAARPESRSFATRLSNLDLTRYLSEIPGTAARFWLGYSRDLVAACRAAGANDH